MQRLKSHIAAQPLRNGLRIALFGSLFALVGAWISEFGFGMRPCELCMLQRYPYMVIMNVAAIGLLVKHVNVKKLALLASFLLFIVDSGIAGYHAGVEKGVFTGPTACSGTVSDGASLDDLRQQILQSEVIACNQPAVEYMGITMASANAVYAALLAVLTFLALAEMRRQEL